MTSKLTQIALDFGPESQSQPVPPPAGNGAVEDPARPYLAAGGVGVRVKSFKQPAVPVPPPVEAVEAPEDLLPRPTVKVVNGDLFGVPAEPQAMEEGAPAEESATPVPASMEVAVGSAGASLEVESAEPVVGSVEGVVESAASEVESVEVGVEGVEPVVEDGALEEEAVAEPVPVTEPATRRRSSPGRTVKQGPSKRGRKSLKQVAAEADLVEIPADEVLFSKQYYTMGEVAAMFQVNQSLLRFWETEFDILQPKKNKKGDRYFRPVDIKSLHLIYHLLRQKKYTIEGAKEFLKKNKKAEDRFEVIQRLQQIKAFLVELKAQL